MKPQPQSIEQQGGADVRYVPTMPLRDLFESPMNTRKHFDPDGLKELEQSIREKGVLTPLLARPVPGWNVTPSGEGRRYEIAAGHRRYRAAIAAGLHAVPAILRDMTDVELLEVLVIENDQREDVHPLEEADGYRRLTMPGTGYDVVKVAARVGRSVKYVYDRLKLLELTKEAQKLFLDGRFTAGHAILLARLKPEDQKRALAVGDAAYHKPALFVNDNGLPFDHEAFEKAAKKDPYLAVKPVSVREFQYWIESKVKFDRDHVDPMLFPETAVTLEKAADEKLKVVLITRDYQAGSAVRKAAKLERVYGAAGWHRADGQEKSKTCERSRVGLVACGPGQGEAFRICIDKERCPVHWSSWQKERKKRQARAAAGDGGGSRAKQEASWKREQEERRQEEVRREAERKRWDAATPAILTALAGALKRASTSPTGKLGEILINAVDEHYGAGARVMVAKYMPRGTSVEDLVRFAVLIVLARELQQWDAPVKFQKRAGLVGLDARKIVDQVAPEKVQTAAEKPAGKKAAKKEGRS
jgi:ParB/RepB/Spo0J family partition protein